MFCFDFFVLLSLILSFNRNIEDRIGFGSQFLQGETQELL